ncbi:MAG: phospholipase D family protein, partial [Acidobacteriota bacterium]|nr:phospholipase D family protein [Acidobacteriota bacterium]
ALRPPPGYTLDCAIGTTFSLDLLTMLTAPLAFTLFDWEDEEGQPTADPLALLEAVRRYSSRISVFCQAAQIAIPKKNQPLLSYLENSVFEVQASHPNGVFHPKVWILRFTNSEESTFYRLLCLSRNLTFDRAWDTVLVLEGEYIGRRNAYSLNHPLGDFVAELPSLALRPLPDKVLGDIKRVQHELRRVVFAPPEGFDEIYFWPLGIEGTRRSWPFNPRGRRLDRMLIVSPFVSAKCLTKLSEASGNNLLMSRPEELDALDSNCLENFEQVFVLNPAADLQEEPDEGAAEAAPESLSGLHAKLYIADAGRKARVWTGSANATNAAFNSNVEFLIELVGEKSRCGINAFLAQAQGQTGFRDMLQEFIPSEEPPDLKQTQLESLADKVRREIAAARFVAHVSPADEAANFRISLQLQDRVSLNLPAETTTRCWPVTLHETTGVTLTNGTHEIATFGSVSFEAITSFFAFEVLATDGERQAVVRFALNVPLEGAPQDRQERILRSLLKNRDSVLRFILFLLAEGGADASAILLATRAQLSGRESHVRSGLELPLFEILVRALDRDPTKLDGVARLVDDLRNSPEGEQLLPEGFDSVWEPIWAARKRLNR